MNKANVENIKSSLPSFLTNLSGYIKTLISLESQKELIGNASGSIGFLIQLFGKPLIDGYYKKVEQNKLSDYGFDTYAMAAFTQANKSLQVVKESGDIPLPEAVLGLEKEFNNKLSEIKKKITVYVFQPKYHPAVQLVKNTVTEMLSKLGVNNVSINLFKKDFNDSIEKTIADAFGDAYEKHRQEVKVNLFKENEVRLLLDIVSNSRIGFVDSEDLKYEEAYGAWKPILSKGVFEESSEVNDITGFEKSLKKVDSLIEEYFSVDPDNHLDKILFVVADFGKGKSVFLKQYAASLAKNYLESGEGYFPVYFNLRTFAKYSSDTGLGVIEDYLQTDYAIKIDSDYFKTKKFVFLIDSLDESGDLSKIAVDKVLNSVKRIQNIDKTTVRSNRLIITSRPFDDVLFEYIKNNKPFLVKQDNSNKDCAHLLSIYGFTKEQFNDWIYNTLKIHAEQLDIGETKGVVHDIVKALKEDTNVDIYSILFDSGTLRSGELRRPIFAYMIYQLLLNNINITQVGKIGIYLSFINLLTKEAKYINDPDSKNKLQEQFEARNILHQIAALWLYEKEKGKQGILKKADVCRIIGGFSTIDSDADVIEKYKRQGLSDIQFLSHSYFGENDNTLHFQHQSFAEVLLAEYYLKVFISCALDKSTSIDFISTKLIIGAPTTQCIEFLKELLQLLKDTIGAHTDPLVLEKRRLLTPLLASIALPANNKELNCQRLYYQWYCSANINEETNEIPQILLENWRIDQEVIDKIVLLCEEVIKAEETFVLSKTTAKTSLISNEVSFIHDNKYRNVLLIEKFLALIVGNSLYNRPGEYFVRKLSSWILIRMLRRDYYWIKNEFKGMWLEFDASPVTTYVSSLNLFSYDFTDAVFSNVVFDFCTFMHVDFSNARFNNVSFDSTFLLYNRFENVRLKGLFDLSSASFQFGFLPEKLLIRNKYYEKLPEDVLERNEMYFWGSLRSEGSFFLNNNVTFNSYREATYFIEEISFYLDYCFKNDYLSVDDVMELFDDCSMAVYDEIFAKLLAIKEGQKSKEADKVN